MSIRLDISMRKVKKQGNISCDQEGILIPSTKYSFELMQSGEKLKTLYVPAIPT